MLDAVVQLVTAPTFGRVLLAAVLALACASTRLPADNPGQALRDLAHALEQSGQPPRLWEVIDQPTRAAWQVAFHARQSAVALLPVLTKDDVELDPDLRALRAAGAPGTPEQLFLAELGARRRELSAEIDVRADVMTLGSEAEFSGKSGDRLPFRRESDGVWRYAGFAAVGQRAAREELGRLERIVRVAALRARE